MSDTSFSRPFGYGVDLPDRAPRNYGTVCRTTVDEVPNVAEELDLAKMYGYTYTGDYIAYRSSVKPKRRQFEFEFLKFIDHHGQSINYGEACDCVEVDGSGFKCRDNHCDNSKQYFMCSPNCSEDGVTCANSPLVYGNVHSWLNHTEVKMIDAATNHRGLFATHDVPEGECLGFYSGAVKVFEPTKFSRYGLRIGLPDSVLEIDAEKFGNRMRFMNHDWDENVRMSCQAFGNGGLIVPFYSVKKIPAGTEIVFNYRYGYDCSIPDDAIPEAVRDFYKPGYMNRFCKAISPPYCFCRGKKATETYPRESLHFHQNTSSSSERKKRGRAQKGSDSEEEYLLRQTKRGPAPSTSYHGPTTRSRAPKS